MTERILCVDDDAHMLESYQRILRGHVAVDVAHGGAEALRLLKSHGAYAIVLSDMCMPIMDGVRFLRQVKTDHPSSIRIMLTGDADQKTAMDAVNEGSIFRFLLKPCSPEALVKAINAGLRQYRLENTERDVLDQTVGGCVRVLTELLSLSDPETALRASYLRERIGLFTNYLREGDPGEIEIAALLATIGRASIPPIVLLKSEAGRPLSPDEMDMLRRVPAIGHKLLIAIPRLENIANIILYQTKQYDGSGFPQNDIAGTRIPYGARLLRVLTDLALSESGGIPLSDAIERLASLDGYYDPVILAAAAVCLPRLLNDRRKAVRQHMVNVRDLRIGHVLRADIRTKEGTLLLATGHSISAILLERLRNSARVNAINEPIAVDALADAEPMALSLDHAGA